jgi:hypothetical protein
MCGLVQRWKIDAHGRTPPHRGKNGRHDCRTFEDGVPRVLLIQSLKNLLQTNKNRQSADFLLFINNKRVSLRRICTATISFFRFSEFEHGIESERLL